MGYFRNFALALAKDFINFRYRILVKFGFTTSSFIIYIGAGNLFHDLTLSRLYSVQNRLIYRFKYLCFESCNGLQKVSSS